MFNNHSMASANNTSTKHTDNHKKIEKKQTNNDKKATTSEQKTKTASNQPQAQPVNWTMPTGGAYPAIAPNEPIWVNVNTEKQRVYIMNANQVIYTMVCSSGLDTSPDTSTPKGTFYIQRERGLSFYNPSEKEGADYWVSWKNHGEFLFHTVATDKNGNFIPSEAAKLGQKASHGCIRLSVPDAKWFYDNIQYHTKVVIS
jgi:lipoprotein-anchoring transpeptidase ErfK/SrfK